MMLAVVDAPELLSSTQLLDGCAVSYRQLDYWTRQGAITPAVQARGSGWNRLWLPGDKARLARIARLGMFMPLTLDLVGACWAADPLEDLRIIANGVELRLPAEQDPIAA